MLSGRSVPNSLLTPDNHGAGLVRNDIPGDSAQSYLFQYTRLQNELSATDFRDLITETRDNWVELYRQLLMAIKIPTVLLWFSKRSPDVNDDFSHLRTIFHLFPQLVNRNMMNQVVPFSDHFLEVTSVRGSPQRLMNRFTGSPASFQPFWGGAKNKMVNDYYPTPHMHVDAADILEPLVLNILTSLND